MKKPLVFLFRKLQIQARQLYKWSNRKDTITEIINNRQLQLKNERFILCRLIQKNWKCLTIMHKLLKRRWKGYDPSFLVHHLLLAFKSVKVMFTLEKSRLFLCHPNPNLNFSHLQTIYSTIKTRRTRNVQKDCCHV